jgi:hypothetical protein
MWTMYVQCLSGHSILYMAVAAEVEILAVSVWKVENLCKLHFTCVVLQY